MASRRSILRRSIALPTDHGTWVFYLSPLIIGLAVGSRWTHEAAYLVVASLCGFLSRQPMTIAVKALSGRRPPTDLLPALLWSTLYALIGSLHLLGLVLRGFGYLLYLAIPGVAVFGWYLYLVARRGERNQILLEILGSGVLALTAPAGLWTGIGSAQPIGWLLWVLTWAQSIASIVFVYLRLRHRRLDRLPDNSARWRMALPAVLLSTVNLLVTAALGIEGIVSLSLFVAYLPQWLEALRAAVRPRIGVKPTAIGIRQLAVSTLFTALFVWAW